MSQGVKPIKHSNCTGVSPALRIHLLRLADSKQATDWGPPRQSDACDALKQPRQCNPICPPKSGVVPPWVPLETRKKIDHTHIPVHQGGAEMPGRKLKKIRLNQQLYSKSLFFFLFYALNQSLTDSFHIWLAVAGLYKQELLFSDDLNQSHHKDICQMIITWILWANIFSLFCFCFVCISVTWLRCTVTCER